MIELDTTNMCSHLQKKLFNEEGVYYPIWQAMQNDDEITAVIPFTTVAYLPQWQKSFSASRQGCTEDYS